jgi:hypothetical protein
MVDLADVSQTVMAAEYAPRLTEVAQATAEIMIMEAAKVAE